MKTKFLAYYTRIEQKRNAGCSSSVTMDQFDESFQNKAEAVLRVLALRRRVKEDDVPCQIEEGLFLGSVAAASNKNELQRFGVTHILTVCSLPPSHPTDFTYKVIEVTDKADENIRQYFDECFNFIDEARRLGGGILVHCFAGQSRSVTIVVAYLMKSFGVSLSKALELVKIKRPLAAPNVGFKLQLKEFEKSLQALEEELTEP